MMGGMRKKVIAFDKLSRSTIPTSNNCGRVSFKVVGHRILIFTRGRSISMRSWNFRSITSIGRRKWRRMSRVAWKKRRLWVDTRIRTTMQMILVMFYSEKVVGITFMMAYFLHSLYLTLMRWRAFRGVVWLKGWLILILCHHLNT